MSSGSAEGRGTRQRTRAGCPVCGCPIAHEEARCAECRWPLHTEWRLGAPAPDALGGFDERLAAARRERDLMAVVRAGLADAAHVRGGTPDESEWARARRIVEVPPMSDAALSAALDAGLARLRPGYRLVVADVGAEGLTLVTVELDALEVPRGHEAPERVPWESVLPMLSGDPGERRFQLAGGLAGLDRDLLWRALEEGLPRRLGRPGDDVLLVHREIGWPVPDRAVRTLRRWHPRAEVVPAGAGGVDTLLGPLAARSPLRHDVGLLAVWVEPGTRRVLPCLLPLFGAGAVSGAQAVVSLRRPPGDAAETVLAAVAACGDRWELLAAGSTRLPQAGTEVRAVLDGPGRVRFTEPSGLAPVARRLPELLSGLPDRFEVLTEPVDLICAVELGGRDDLVERRLDLVRALVSDVDAAYPDSNLVRVAALGYRDHAYGRGKEGRQTVIGEWLATPATALGALSRLRPSPVQYPEAAPVEDMLHRVSAQLAGGGRPSRRRPRTILLTVGGRPPHPSVQGDDDDVLPCQFELSWQVAVSGLSRAGVSCAAVVDHGPTPRGALDSPLRRHPVWDTLAATALHELDDIDPRQLGVHLGLLPSAPQTLPLPLAEPERGTW